MWKIMIAICIDPKIVRIIESIYNETECAVVIDGHLFKNAYIISSII